MNSQSYMRLVPKHERHPLEDGTTTRFNKAQEMLRDPIPRASMQQHRRAESAVRWAIGIVCVGIILLAIKHVGLMAHIERMMR